jgi:hypothetical protein
MHDEDIVAVEPTEKIFGAPIQSKDAHAREALHKSVGEGKAKIRPPLLDVDQPLTFQRRPQPLTDGFDFG